MRSLKRNVVTTEKLDAAVRILKENNPFFHKLPSLLGVCLLRIGKFRLKEENEILYNIDHKYVHFYVILSGRVKLTGKYGMGKTCEAGETLL